MHGGVQPSVGLNVELTNIGHKEAYDAESKQVTDDREQAVNTWAVPATSIRLCMVDRQLADRE